ncbi:MAG: hypothetical protein NTY02_05885 [Acidobacteria bacterium]|nr:hypothetical protein [Acidobacteriota bacterium]
MYERIQSDDAKPKVSLMEGGGWGRMNVQQVCERAGIPVDTGIERLRAAGLQATGSSSLRELGTAQGRSPIDIARIIAGPDAEFPATGDQRPDADRAQADDR